MNFLILTLFAAFITLVKINSLIKGFCAFNGLSVKKYTKASFFSISDLVSSYYFANQSQKAPNTILVDKVDFSEKNKFYNSIIFLNF